MPNEFDRIRSLGLNCVTGKDLLALGLARRATDVEGTFAISEAIWKRFRSVADLRNLSASELKELGFDEFESLRALALLELGRRIGTGETGEMDEIDGPADVYRLLSYLRNEKQEHFVAVYLDAKNKIVRRATVHIGTLTMSVVGAREVFRYAVREGASALIVAHNHPSGDPEPSPEDIQVTKHLAEAGTLLDIPLLDHVVIGDRRWVSLADRGYVG